MNGATELDEAAQSGTPGVVRSTAELGVAFWHAGDGTPAHPESRVVQWPERNRSRMTHPLYDQETLEHAYRLGFIEGQLNMRERDA